MKLNISSLLVIALIVSFGAKADYTHDEKKAPEWLKYTQPGTEHKRLTEVVGNWKHTLKWWANPTDKAMESKGTNTNKMIMGGRFLQQDAKSTAMGKPFQGMGVTGYDLLKGQYQSVWLDNMGTSIMHSTGTYDEATKTISESGTFSDAMTGDKERWYRSEWKFIDKNNYTYTMFVKDAEGKEFKSMEITYKRS